MIEARGLAKQFGSTVAISDVSFKADKGEIVGFLGPNGAGKTTTMRILTCYLPPAKGTAVVAGFDVQSSPLEVRKRIGYLPENVPLYEDMTVRNYLGFVAEVKGIKGKKARLNQVEEVTGSCGLDSVNNRIIGHLSRGYKQRVGLAQALLGDPEVLILDEPTIGLDPGQIIEIRNLIKNLAGHRTVILSTHILPEVELLCSRVIIINKGRIVAQDTPKNLIKKFHGAARVLVTMTGDASNREMIHTLKGVHGVKDVERHPSSTEIQRCFLVESELDKDIRPGLSETVVSSGYQLLGIEFQEISLEELFMKTITGEEGVNE